jgi:hypothetical protein
MTKKEKLAITQLRIEEYNAFYDDVADINIRYWRALKEIWQWKKGAVDVAAKLAKYGLAYTTSKWWEVPRLYEWDWQVKDLNKAIYKDTKQYQEKVQQMELGI